MHTPFVIGPRLNLLGEKISRTSWPGEKENRGKIVAARGVRLEEVYYLLVLTGAFSVAACREARIDRTSAEEKQQA